MGRAVSEYTNIQTSHHPVANKYTFLSTTEINKQKTLIWSQFVLKYHAPREKRKENKSYSDGTEVNDDATKWRHQVAPALTQVTIHSACQLRNYVVLDEISFPFFYSHCFEFCAQSQTSLIFLYIALFQIRIKFDRVVHVS